MAQWNQERFLEKIDEIIKNECDGVQSKFNAKIGIRDAVTRWKAGAVPKQKTLEKIAETFPAYTIDWLYSSPVYVSESGALYELSADDHNVMQAIGKLTQSQKIELLRHIVGMLGK